MPCRPQFGPLQRPQQRHLSSPNRRCVRGAAQFTRAEWQIARVQSQRHLPYRFRTRNLHIRMELHAASKFRCAFPFLWKHGHLQRRGWSSTRHHRVQSHHRRSNRRANLRPRLRSLRLLLSLRWQGLRKRRHSRSNHLRPMWLRPPELAPQNRLNFLFCAISHRDQACSSA